MFFILSTVMHKFLLNRIFRAILSLESSLLLSETTSIVVH